MVQNRSAPPDTRAGEPVVPPPQDPSTTRVAAVDGSWSKRHATIEPMAESELPRFGAPAIRALASIGVTRVDQLADKSRTEMLGVHGLDHGRRGSSTRRSPLTSYRCVRDRPSCVEVAAGRCEDLNRLACAVEDEPRSRPSFDLRRSSDDVGPGRLRIAHSASPTQDQCVSRARRVTPAGCCGNGNWMGRVSLVEPWLAGIGRC